MAWLSIMVVRLDIVGFHTDYFVGYWFLEFISWVDLIFYYVFF